MSTLVPNAVSVLTAHLRANGFEFIELFDTTFYQSSDESKDENRVRMGQVQPFDFDERNVSLKTTDMYVDFLEKVEDFRPDLIAATILEDTFPIFTRFMELVEDKKIPTVVGGVFPSTIPERLAELPYVHYVCRGEGEDALLELCNALNYGDRPTKIANLWIKDKGKVVEENPIRRAMDVNTLPIQDLSIFESESLFRPMMGKVYRMAPVETQRGCPYSCRFCNSPEKNEFYKMENAGLFFRKRTIENVRRELEVLVLEHGIEYIFFVTDTFLAMSEKEFDHFCEIYETYKLPFFMNTRPETITEYRAKRLKSINCHRVNIGVEHGNEEFREKVIGRKYDNQVAINAFEMMYEAGISTVANNIIGYPDETRNLVFDSIELTRKLKSSDVNAFTFTPYQGTSLRRLCEEKGYVSADALAHIYTKDSMLDMPSMSREEIRGLMKTFVLYSRLPRNVWDDIARAEQDTPEGNEKYEELMELYQREYSTATLGHDYIIA